MVMAAILVMWPGPFEQTLFLHAIKASHKIRLQFVQLFKKKKSFNFDIWVTLDQGQWVTLTFGTHAASFTHLADCLYQL